MDNKNTTPPNPEDTAWLDELLETSNYGDDALAQMQPLDTSDELDLEKILQEAKSGKWDDAPAPQAETQPAYIEANVIPPEEFEFPEDDPDEEIPAAEESEDQEELPEETEEFEDSDRKVRPKRKNTYGLFGLPHLLSTAIWVLIVVTIGISLGRLMWMCATDVLAFGRENRVTTITITDSDAGNIDAIADKLYNAGLIKYKQLFKFYAALSNADEKISVGTFELNTLFDYNALVKGMSPTSSYRESVKVTIPEGYTCAQIFALLEEKGVCSAAELKAYRVQSDYWFLENAKPNAEYPLEGFLFPDTYNFYINDTPQGVFRRFLARFEDIFTEELREYITALNDRLGTNYSVYEIMIVASMIEKESAGSGENYDISSVIYNRLTKPNEFPFLNIDATIVYAQGGNADVIDKDLDSPYNTYKYRGLPPTPICNPSLLSIQAALSPTETQYHYYALDPSTGMHHFSKTYQEHQDFLDSLR